MGEQSALRKMTINNLALLYEGRGKRIAELEALNRAGAAHALKQTIKLMNEKQELINQVAELEAMLSERECEMRNRGIGRRLSKAEALLGKEKNDG